MTMKGYHGKPRSNQAWVDELLDNNSQRQTDAFTDLGAFLRYYIVNDIYQRAGSIPALAPLALVELEAVADEIVQEALIRIYKRVAGFIDHGSFLSYALIVARHLLIDEFRRKQWTTMPLAPQGENDTEDAPRTLRTLADLADPRQSLTAVDAVFQEMAGIVYDALHHDLSESQAAAFIAYEFLNLSSKEIAPLMGRSAMAVDQLRHQARLKIKQRLRDHGYDENDVRLR